MSYTTRWESAPARPRERETEPLPEELLALRDAVRTMPAAVRSELEPLVADALDQAAFRGRALALARDGLSQLRLELELARFDLDVTRREREELRQRIV